MSELVRKDILSLSIAERLALVAEIWDSIAEVQKAELDKRLDAYHQNPTAGSPWHVVKDRIAGRT